MAFEPSAAFLFNAIGGIVMALFGVFVLKAGVGGRANRSFAVFAIGFGIAVALRALAESSDPGDPWTGATWAVAAFLWLVGAAGLLGLAMSFPMRVRRDEWRVMALPAGLLLVFLGLSVAFVVYVARSRPGWSAWVGAEGLYGPFSGFMVAVWTVLLIVFPLRHRRVPASFRGRLRWMAGALTLYPAFSAGAFAMAVPLVAAIHMGVIAVASGLWLRETLGDGPSRAARDLALLPFLMGFLGLVVAVVEGGYGGLFGTPGIIRVASVAVMAYGILRTQLFDIDLKVKWTLRRGTLAGIFVATIFIVSEAAQEFFGETTGSTYLGIAAAGLLVFAIAPLQRFADRVADAALPEVRNTEAYVEERKRTVYRGAVESAMADGSMTPKERRLLLRLQGDLGLSGDEANRIEAELLDAMAGAVSRGGAPRRDAASAMR